MSDGRFPNLLVIGAMKAGTTSLHDYLGKHPDVFMSEPKEIHYYAEENFKQWSTEKYLSFFQSNKKYLGTSPQSYTKCHNKNYQDIPKRIHQDTPDVRLIYIVRDPIERYRSDIFESYYCDPKEEIGYNFAINGFLKTSMYGMQLKAFLKFFPLEQIHILSLEELNSHPLLEMNRIFDFLGIKHLNDPSLFSTIKNASSEKDLPRAVKDSFSYRAVSKFMPKVSQKLGEWASKTFHSEKLTKLELSEAQKEELRSQLQEDIDEFRRITNKKFDFWSL